LNILVAHNDDPTNTLIVRFADQEKPGVKDIKDFCQKMEQESITSTILIVQKGLTNIAREV
jgi:DNA-directed RNA polymerase I, II, and III subunit RPABC1